MKEAMPELPPVHIDIERMEKLLKGPRYMVPNGLTAEQIGEFFDAMARVATDVERERDSMWQARLEEAVRAEKAQSAELRETLEMIAAQGSALPGSTSRVDCMAALAAAAIRAKE